jgi:hypothetical protein
MISNATVQSTIVLAKRKTKTDRAVAGFASAVVSGMGWHSAERSVPKQARGEAERGKTWRPASAARKCEASILLSNLLARFTATRFG